MRTRTSVRNQNIVFRELFKPQDKPKPIRFASCFNCVSYPKSGRSRGECVLRGAIVEGRTLDRPCFKDRLTNEK